MSGRTNNRRYLLWLALGTATMALAMASLLVFVIAQKRAIDQGSAIRSDSLTALVFQFEREFLRMRQVMGETLASDQAPNKDAISLRYDILQSRLNLLQDNPSVSLLVARPEYAKVMPRMQPLMAELGAAIDQLPSQREALAQVQGEFSSLGVDVQALTMAANSEVAHMLERQADTVRQQNSLIVGLTVAQLVLLLLASGALLLRQRRHEAERQALEQLTEELRDARLRAEAANRGKSQFLANMSHELRTPFNGLMGMLGLLADSSLTPQQADYIQTARVSAGHLLTLLNDILDLSALEAGKLGLKPREVSVEGLLSDVQSLMSPLAKDKGLRFRMELPTEPLPIVVADETRVKQILFNLISNAIKFTEVGQVQLRASLLSRDRNSLVLQFAVQDTGIGMNQTVLSRLFQRFYQVDDSSTRKFGGTGLGLEISQSLARMMQGEITVVSAVGQGSTFTVTLRLPVSTEPMAADRMVETAPAPLTMPAALTPSSNQVTEPEESPLVSQRMRILVVEDHPINQKLVGVLLGHMGCDVTFCENGQLAIERVQEALFDMVLMDVNMPVMDGLTATRHIRALEGPGAEVPIVVLTADVMNDARGQALGAGATDFLSKPVQLEQLRELVLRYAGGAMAT